MNDNARAWISELRTTEKEQGNTFLNKGGKFCCLGIGCELALASGLNMYKGVSDTDKGEVQYGSNACNPRGGNACNPPREFIKWAGLNFKGINRCIEMNDEEKKTFTQIAFELTARSTEYFELE